MPAMRGEQEGEALDRDNAAGFNFAKRQWTIRAFDEAFYFLMCGCGPYYVRTVRQDDKLLVTRTSTTTRTTILAIGKEGTTTVPLLPEGTGRRPLR